MAAGREKRVFKTNNPKTSSAKPKSKSAKPKSNSVKPKTNSVKPKSKPAIPKIVQVSPSEQNVQPSDNPQDEEQVDPSLDQIKRDSLEKSVQIEPEPYEVQRKVCNPCGCCCCKCCTLRVNCMVIAVYGVLSALWWTMVGVKIALVIILLYGIVTVLTAISITIAVFRRLKEAALGAFGGWISSAVFFMAFCWTITSFFDDYVQMITSIPMLDKSLGETMLFDQTQQSSHHLHRTHLSTPHKSNKNVVNIRNAFAIGFFLNNSFK
ncbi:unnamed protein product [Allacma fusca]|uniref:Transmembrane protein n=1 Tax=Allacma fusca TaxID=39272 RepID=A0A8J2PLT8_9HEXA|nr:unnamed protein product [Allacma fusca]